jgi:hypothetical protein
MNDNHERYHNADIGFEVEVVAKLTGLTRHQAFNLIQKHGRDREQLVREAKLLKDQQTDAEAIGKRKGHLLTRGVAPIAPERFT